MEHATPPARPSRPGSGLALFGGLSLVVLGDVALTGRSYLLRDILTFFHPWQHAIRESVRSGHLPLWNHHTYCGIPLLANLQSGFFYPVNWLQWVLPFDLALTAGMVIHLTVAGVAMRGFLRRVGIAGVAAAAGGIAFAYGAWATSHLEFPMKLGASVWLPLVWSGVWDAMREGRRSGLAIAGGAFALSLFAGYPQMTMLGGLSATLLAAVLVPGVVLDTRLDRATRLHRAAAWPVAALLGGTAAAVQLVPGAEMARLSSKAAGYDAAVAMSRSLAPKLIAGFVDPFFGGFPGVDRFWGGEVMEYAFAAFYPGAIGVVLAVLALTGARKLVRTGVPGPAIAFLGLGVGAGLFLALGKHTPLYGFLHAWAPGFGRSRWPATAVFLVAIHAAALVGVGFHAAVATGRTRRASFALLGAGGALLALAVLANGPLAGGIRSLQLAGSPPFQSPVWEAGRSAWIGSVLTRAGLLAAAGIVGLTLPRLGGSARRVVTVWAALLLLDLALVHRAYETPTARGFYESVPEAVVELRTELDGRRVFTGRETDQLGNFLYGSRNPVAFAWAQRALLCNANVPADIDQAHGCEPLNPRRHEAFVQAFDSPGTPWEIKERIFDLWDAALWIASSLRPLEVGGLTDPAAGLVLSRHEPRLGRASVLFDWRVLADGETVLGRLLSPDHDPARRTLLEIPVPGSAPALPPDPGAASPENAAWSLEPNRIHVTVRTERPGMLRILESWAPGWRATVNGEPAPVHRADFLFLAVPLPAGPCEVRLEYRPASLRIGFALTLLGFAGLGACAWWPERRNS